MHILDYIRARAEELERGGMSRAAAFDLAHFEYDVEHQWIESWGDDLVVYVSPLEIDHDIEIPELGIRISAAEVRKGCSRYLMARECRIRVFEKTVPAVLDALRRLDSVLNLWAAIDSYSPRIRYECHFFQHGGGGSKGLDNHLSTISWLSTNLRVLRIAERELFLRAAWWARQGRSTEPWEGVRSPFQEYVASWNAFECLIELGCRLNPIPKMSVKDKNRLIGDYFSHLNRSPTVEDIQDLYRKVVNPGLPGRAYHALHSLLRPTRAEEIHELCFTRKPQSVRLYQIRNDIAHANIVEHEYHDRLRVDEALSRLRGILSNLFVVWTGRISYMDYLQNRQAPPEDF